MSGDDITMGTNTAGNLLIADGTNFNSIAVGGLSEISTVANDDVFLAVDTSGGGLKKLQEARLYLVLLYLVQQYQTLLKTQLHNLVDHWM